jgi:hypothetical protein
MKCNYFVHDGKQYNSGTVIRVRMFNHITGKVQEKNAVFIEYDNESKMYKILVDGIAVEYTERYFNHIFCCIFAKNNTQNKTHTANVQKREKSFTDELNIDGLGLAWMWYVFIMLVAIIFYDRVVIWVAASVVFFQYRDKKLKEAGYK